jgi:serine/threonine protein kinase
MKAMPLARRRCPYCRTLLPVGEETQSLEVVFLREKLSGRFEIISELRRRGIGLVFLAHDLILEHQIIIKTLHLGDIVSRELLAKWEQNAKRAIRLDHPNVARNYTYGKAGPLYYFISEHIPHGTMADSLLGGGSVPLWKCLRIGRDLARGIHAGYKMGIAHHRLKPDNLAVSVDGFTQILDFGSAQGTIDALSVKPWSADCESSLYLAPEQIETGLSDHLSDQYTIGLIMYQMLTGRHPFPDPGESGAVARLNTQVPPIRNFNADVPHKLELIINQVLSIDPSMRYEDCHEFSLALESLEPELWTPVAEEPAHSTKDTPAVSEIIDQAKRAQKNRQLHEAVFLCEQALVLAPYIQEVTDLLAELRKNLDRENEVRSLINNGLSAFYEKRLDSALTVLTRARQIDKDNPEIIRLTHEVLQEQERLRLTTVLIQAARIDLSQNALAQAMAKVVRIQDIDPGNEDAALLKNKIESVMEDKATLGVLLSRAEDAVNQENWDQVETEIEKILSIDPAHHRAGELANRIQDVKRRNKVSLLKNKLESDLRNGSSQGAVKTIEEIADLDPALADELHDKIDRIKSVLADERKPHSERISDESPEKVQAPLELPPDDPEKPMEEIPFVSLMPDRKPVNWVPYLGFAVVVIICLILIGSFVRFSTGDKDGKTVLSESPTALPILPTETFTPQSTPSVTPAPQPTSTPRPPIPTRPSVEQQVEWLLARAQFLEKQKHDREAAQTYKRILSMEKTNLVAQGGYARCLRRLTSEPIPPIPILEPTPEPTTALINTPKPILPTSSPFIPATAKPAKTEVKIPAGFSIEDVLFSPSPPVEGKKLKITVKVMGTKRKQIIGVWFNYRMRGETGFSQYVGKRYRNQYKFEIPGQDIRGDRFYYFISAMDKSGREITRGSPNHLKWIPISNDGQSSVKPNKSKQ